jgi:hypothetical protein
MQSQNEFGLNVTEVAVGALAGLAATVPMTAVMAGIHRLLPRYERYPLEPYRVTTRLARRAGVSGRLSRRQREAAATVAHFGYGAAAGAAFVPLAARLPVPLALAGAVFGLLVWAASYAGWLPALGVLTPPDKQPRRRNALLVIAHVVWGAAMGWLVESQTERRLRL